MEHETATIEACRGGRDAVGSRAMNGKQGAIRASSPKHS